MGQGQLKRNQFKVFYAWLGPNQTVSAFTQELTTAWKQSLSTINATVTEQAAAVIRFPVELEGVHGSEKQGAAHRRDADYPHYLFYEVPIQEVDLFPSPNKTFLFLLICNIWMLCQTSLKIATDFSLL